ncbi:MAG: sulfatase-like hydrolase/transferase, partial [Bacteroidetes bacterium]|nr:sulfatase-like hydrolase/transferase [Bacteroidota bacterium]
VIGYAVRRPSNKPGVTRLQYDYSHMDSTPKPDIYFIILDEYASSVSLQQQYNYHNSLDEWLRKRGFSIQAGSYSNYSFTPLSIASIMNMSYISGMKTGDTISVPDFNHCLGLIKNNEVIHFLSGLGYDIRNYSTFDLEEHPATTIETLLPTRTRLITANTLLSRMGRDMAWVFFKGPLARWFYDPVGGARKINRKILDNLAAQSSTKEQNPIFVYGHLYMPHGPYLYDSSGHPTENAYAIQPPDSLWPSAYLQYLAYANGEIKKLVTTIRSNTHDKAVIILMGDHGFRRYGNRYLRQNYQNFNAVYLPGGDYHQFYDSVTCVNQFKIILNTLFHQSIPLQKDSTLYLTGMQ